MSYKGDIFVIYSALTSKKSFNAFCKDINSLNSKFSTSSCVLLQSAAIM
nr:MAG TPA: hypothetical protein [Caudoviricetes sp.]